MANNRAVPPMYPKKGAGPIPKIGPFGPLPTSQKAIGFWSSRAIKLDATRLTVNPGPITRVRNRTAGPRLFT